MELWKNVTEPHALQFFLIWTFQWIYSILTEWKLLSYLSYSNMLKLGSSKPWQDALEALSGTRQMSADALLEYFQPLMDWLKEENQKNGVTIGWEEECPGGFVPDNSSQPFVSYILLLLLSFCHYAFLEWVNVTVQTFKKNLRKYFASFTQGKKWIIFKPLVRKKSLHGLIGFIFQ